LYLIKLVFFDIDPNLINATVLNGLLTAWTPILIVWGAIFLFKTMEYTGAMDTIRTWLNGVTTNKVAQAMIVGWAFAFLIEGASGFGTPAAIAAPILVGLGFPAVRVAILCLIMNSVPVHFGAVGTPGWFGLGQLGLSSQELMTIGINTAIIHGVAALVIPVIALIFALSFAEVRKNLVYVYLSILSCIVPYIIFARFNYEFPSIVGGTIGLVVSVALAHYRVGLAKGDDAAQAANAKHVPLPALIKATFPLWGTVLLLLATRINQLGIKPLLVSAEPLWNASLGTLGDIAVSKSLVVSLSGIFGTATAWKFQTLYVPALIPFFTIAAVTFVLFKAKGEVVSRTLNESATQMKKPIMALLSALVFVKLLMVGGEQASTLIIGQALADTFGQQWQYFASYLGALGAFFSGSNTVSNLTFGGIQLGIAQASGLSPTSILAYQSVGGAMGNMTCIHNIVAVCSVLGLSADEGFILKRTVIPMLAYGVIAAATGALLLG
ncbi:L-lactate permease, partial [Trichloromonas sp.]|uniref:L-lactate permease n=1 Tax=Trichloromonas sp. TaxID=3069249 RepID=UPI003D81A275